MGRRFEAITPRADTHRSPNIVGMKKLLKHTPITVAAAAVTLAGMALLSPAPPRRRNTGTSPTTTSALPTAPMTPRVAV
jgi:hypothetical protein